MKRILTILIILLSAIICRAQKMDFADERGTYPIRVADVDKLIEEKQGSLNRTDFEFRLYISNGRAFSGRFFVMRFSDGIWNAYLYRIRHKTIEWEAVEMRSDGLDSLWQVLEYNKVLTLPDQATIRNRMIAYTPGVKVEELGATHGIRTVITEGIMYQVQLRQGGRVRAYSYDDPDYYLTRNPNIEELYRADAIGRLVMDYIKRNEIKD